MANTVLREDAKRQIIKVLREQGYPTYARLLGYFDVYLTDDPKVVGYMIPGKAKIVLNQNLSINQVSTIVRHEILHEYLTHAARADKVNATRRGNSRIANIAADFEISNRGYTQADKSIARRIQLGDKTLQGLVTEDSYPGWEHMTFEEMYNKLLDQHEADENALKDLMDLLDAISGQTMEDLEDALNGSDSSNKSDPNSSQGGDSNSTASGGPLSDSQKAALDKALQGAQGELEKIDSDDNKSTSGSEGPFDSAKDQRDKADVAKRVIQIREILADKGMLQSARDEATAAIRRETASRAADEVRRIQTSGIHQFKLNLNRFIADQIGEFEDDSYARINPSYEDSEFIIPGKIVRETKNVPVINVYWDVSASFSDAAKTESARKAIATLNEYERDGDIELLTYYFATRVSETREGAGSGTRGTPIQEHIEQTQPTNVIIITDSDISDCHRTVVVPGAVWMLFYDGRSQNVMEHIRGKKQNKYYDIVY